jgi:hypothetical protein
MALKTRHHRAPAKPKTAEPVVVVDMIRAIAAIRAGRWVTS